MSQNKMILANWKMNLTATEAKTWLAEFIKLPQAANREIAIFPSFTTLAQIFSLKPDSLALGAQNCYFQPSGAYTGEISIKMLQELKVKYVLLGHSERRQLFNETNELIAQKLEALLLTSEISPVLCIGEHLTQRESNTWQEHIAEQLKATLLAISEMAIKCLDRVIVAYEPIWAIGTGKSASLEEIEEVHKFIRQTLTTLRPSWAAPRVLYGGSVKSASSAKLLASSQIDGLLVGGASLKPEEFSAIINS